MPTTAPDGRLNVAVGILRREDGAMLVQQRMPGKDCEGQWEFPGGKIEKDESAEAALRRELMEELGVTVTRIESLIQLPFDYTHANVWLQVYQVLAFDGDVKGCEGQIYQWRSLAEILTMDVLDAVHPILDALTEADNTSS